MRLVFFVFFFSIIGSITLAGNPDCIRAFDARNIYNVNLKFYNTKPKISYDNSRSHRSLKNMSHQHAHSHHVTVNGLTVAQYNSGTFGDFYILDLNDGSQCVMPKNITAKLGYSSIVVFIANEYKPGSCEYNAIIEHENEHVKANINVFNARLNNLKAKTASYVKATFPIKMRSSSPETQALNLIQSELVGNIKQIEKLRDQVHSKIDSPESYAYTESLCKNWE